MGVIGRRASEIRKKMHCPMCSAPPTPPPSSSRPQQQHHEGGGPAFQALLAATEAAAADWGAGAAAASLQAAAGAALAEVERAERHQHQDAVGCSPATASPAATSSSTAKPPTKGALRRLLEEAGWDGSSFSSSPTPFDARALLSRLKTLHFDDLEEVGKGSYAVVYKVRREGVFSLG